MSAISDFNKVWVQKFPGSELPTAWEEDVKTNLAKHKKRVEELQEELEKERVYVQFLESLLEEVEKKKGEVNNATNSISKEGSAVHGGRSQERDNINDAIQDTLERHSLAQQMQNEASAESSHGGVDCKGSLPTEAIEEKSVSVHHHQQQQQQSSGRKGSSGDAPATSAPVKDDHRREAVSEDGDSGEENGEDAKDHFVTVIEVNGFEKEKLANTSSHGVSKSNNSNNNEEIKRLKKVPPRPPPKSFKRPDTTTQNGGHRSTSNNNGDSSEVLAGVSEIEGSNSRSASGQNSAKSSIDRTVVFDSRKNSTGSMGTNSSSGSESGGQKSSHPANSENNTPAFPPKTQSSHGGASTAAISKRFEGSKLPLPPTSAPQSDLDDKVPTKPAKSHKFSADYNPFPQVQSANSSSSSSSSGHLREVQISERESSGVRSKILDLVNKMESSNKSKHMEQLTPKRSNSAYQKRRGESSNSSRYHLHGHPAAESIVSDYIDPCDAEFDANNDQIYDSPPPEPDLAPMQAEPERRCGSNSRKKTLEKNNPESFMDNASAYNEPMYDTVAPDQEDDYVMLSEEANQSSSLNNSLSKKDSSLESIGGRNNAEIPLPSGTSANNNNDGATIKSQTSVISGHSVATTTSSGTTSDTDGFTSSPLPNDTCSDGKGPSANYVNIDYFLSKSKRKDSRASGESEEDEPAILRAISFDPDGETDDTEGDITDSNLDMFDIDSGVYSNTIDAIPGSGSSGMGSGGYGEAKGGPAVAGGGLDAVTMTAADQEKYAMFRTVLANIAESESAYVEALNVMIQYMKPLKASLATSKPVLSTDDFNIIFYKIPELFALHQKFLMGLQQKTPSMTVGKHFECLAREIGVYGAFLQNYSRAVDTVRKCSQNNADFAASTKSIRLRSMNKNQIVSLETLLYIPVSRIQKNIEIIQDLLKYLPESHPDHKALRNALREFQSFLSEFKMIQPEQLFQGQDRNPRHLVKNSFIVELSEGHRKLRHLFLFNDVLVCAKYKASGKGEKFTFELKWYIPVADCAVVEESTEPRESATINLVALRSQASTVRDQIKRQTSRDDPKKAKAEKQRKKLAELEAQLVLASPNLVFKVKGNGRAYTFFLSSEFERSQWVDAIETLKSGQLSSPSNLSMHELQSWLTSCRKHLKTNMGSYLLRTGRDENLLVGDFYVLIGQLTGIQRPADLYVCLEVDSYGHFFRKAKTKMICETTKPNWNQDFVIELEGAQNLRILLYEDHPKEGTLIRGKTTIELSRSWLTCSMNERKIELHDYTLTVSTKFVPSEMTIRRVPTAKPSGLYGAKITQVCKREKRQVPFVMTSCVREVERRGINEVGIYRVSGSASDVSRLKRAFETNAYEAEQLLKDVDIHSVTGALKMYMRELPEALFTDDLYPRFFEAFNLPDPELKRKTLLQLFSTLPPINQHIIVFLLDHMTRINSHENHNKMSLHNMATVFGPTLLRPGARSEGTGNTDLLAAGTVDVMAQAGILYFFLARRANGESLTNSQ